MSEALLISEKLAPILARMQTEENFNGVCHDRDTLLGLVYGLEARMIELEAELANEKSSHDEVVRMLSDETGALEKEVSILRADLAVSRAATETTRGEADLALRRLGALEAWVKVAVPAVELVRAFQDTENGDERSDLEADLQTVNLPPKGSAQ